MYFKRLKVSWPYFYLCILIKFSLKSIFWIFSKRSSKLWTESNPWTSFNPSRLSYCKQMFYYANIRKNIYLTIFSCYIISVYTIIRCPFMRLILSCFLYLFCLIKLVIKYLCYLFLLSYVFLLTDHLLFVIIFLQ